ncbi:MAG TPA: hypothetical protein VKE25_14015 [Actinomycetes bacterium]|nr:hypothetical protein [Actinomycetes bacterium]
MGEALVCPADQPAPEGDRHPEVGRGKALGAGGLAAAAQVAQLDAYLDELTVSS